MSYSAYKENVIKLIQDLDNIERYCVDLNMNGAADAAASMSEHLRVDEFNVAVVGEFNRGKSTLINALLGKRVLPDAVLPTTAVVNKVKYGIKPSVAIEYKDGQTEEIPVGELKAYVTKLTAEGAERAKTIKEATVYYPTSYCKNGITLIDTPGLNENKAMTDVTLTALAEADAAILTMIAGVPFSETEQLFLSNHLLMGDIGRVLFVVTQMDHYDEEDQQTILEDCRRRITKYVLEASKNLYGEDSIEYRMQQRKLGQLHIYGVSARNAALAKERGDRRMLEESNFLEFELGLERFLTEERGLVALSAPVSRIKSTAVELSQAIELRENALNMEAEDFHGQYQRALEEMERLREVRARELGKVTDAANAVYAGLGEQIDGYWPALRAAALSAVDGYPISKKELRSKKGRAALRDGMSDDAKAAMVHEAQKRWQQIQGFINRGLTREIDSVADFEKEFEESTERIQSMFVSPDKSPKKPSLGNTVGETAANGLLFPGIGSLLDGYRRGGWKGALVGGVTGGATTSAAFYGIEAVLLILCPEVAVPIAAISHALAGVAGLFVGRKVVDKTSHPSPKAFRSDFKEALIEQLNEQAISQDISGTVRKQVVTMFDALKQKVTDESERVLVDMQTQLSDLEMEVSRRETLSDKEKEKLNEMAQSLDGIAARALALEEQLNSISEHTIA